MKSALLFARYVLFGLFVVCNAIICSAAVWNHSLVQADDAQTSQVDIYLIFLGAFSLALIFPIIFADLLCSDPFSARVWFECAWIILIWLMQLAAAAAVTAIAVNTQCTAEANVLDFCLSIRVILAFTWICTIILLLYLFLLVATAVTTQRIDPGVWHHNVRYLRIETTRQCLPSAQNSPVTPNFNQSRGAPVVHNPRAIRPVLPIYERHAGLSSEYDIEPYRPYVVDRMSMDSLPEAVSAPPVSHPTPAFIYSQNIRRLASPEIDPPPAPRLQTSIVYTKPVLPSIPVQQASPSAPFPSAPSPSAPSTSPFNWPRANVMDHPVKARKKPLPSAFEFPRRSAQGPSELPSNFPTDPLSHPRTRRPSGPRLRVPSCDETAPHLTRPNL